MGGNTKMEIKSTLTNSSGQVLDVIYAEGDQLSGLEGKILQGVHAFCFYEDQMVLVNHPKSGWMPPGGGIEDGETYEEAVVREVKEETNMKVLHQELIGFQDTYDPRGVVRQTRSFCIVEPYGDFVADPDGEIMEIKLIDPADYKKYFDWGAIGERIMKRAMELRNSL
jgi:ADP-ribose pyrophosphatase YjhB (NUDIX family)